MPEVQEDVAELAIRWMIKVPKLSGDLIVAALKHCIKKVEDKEPVGKQSIKKLMRDGNQKTERVDLKLTDGSVRELHRLAAQYGVGFTAFQDGENYTLFFRAGRAEQMAACVEAYGKRQLEGHGKKSIKERLNAAIQQEATQRIKPSLKDVEQYRQRGLTR